MVKLVLRIIFENVFNREPLFLFSKSFFIYFVFFCFKKQFKNKGKEAQGDFYFIFKPIGEMYKESKNKKKRIKIITNGEVD